MASGSGSVPQRSSGLSLFAAAGKGHRVGEICDQSGGLFSLVLTYLGRHSILYFGGEQHSFCLQTCQVCRKGDNDDCLLLCDGCDRGCHMYCLKPKITQVPEGDWFCPTCIDQVRTGLWILFTRFPKEMKYIFNSGLL